MMRADPVKERPVHAGRLPRDMLAGAVLLAFCAAVYALSLGIDTAPAALAQNTQPATFPRLVIAVIAVLSALMILLGLRSLEPARRAPKPVMLATGAMMLAFAMVFETWGPLLAMFLFCLALPLLWGERLSWRLVLFALAVPLGVHLVFAVGLSVQFPPGLLETRLKALF